MTSSGWEAFANPARILLKPADQLFRQSPSNDDQVSSVNPSTKPPLQIEPCSDFLQDERSTSYANLRIAY
jgi:hypothetical protein